MRERSRFNPRPLFWLLMALIAIVGAVVADDGSLLTNLGLSHDDVLQACYLVIILLFVGSALLGRRLGAGEIVRAATSWLALLLILVVGYAYREELSQVGGRMLSVLAPGMPIPTPNANGDGGTSVIVVRSLDGHFAVRATANDQKITFLVDTGASYVTLTPRDAGRIGIDLAALAYTMPIRTANGEIKAAPVRIEDLAIGTIERKDVSALVAPDGSLDQSLLGMSFLDTLASYAVAGNRLIMTP